MNETKITDDLLEELEELESSAAQMDTQVGDAQAKKTKLEQLDSSSTIDATSLALEAAKTAQDAASQSQKAAEASLTHANRQKEQIMELSEANFSWRQAVKSATKQIRSAKSSFTIMLSISIITSITALSVMGWLLYSMQKKEAMFKGEILDILQTENALLAKQITIKTDELSALIELMTADIQKINKMGMDIKANTAANLPQANQTTTEVAQPQQTDSTPLLNLASEADATQQQPETDAAQSLAKTEPAASESVQAEPSTEQSAPAMQTQPSMTASSSATGLSDKHYAEIKALIETILSEQHKLQAKTMVPAATMSGSGLTATQEKQLKDISWLVRKQAKTLEQIKNSLGAQAGSANGKQTVSKKQTEQSYKAIQGSLIELKDQLQQLQLQQKQLQSQVDSLQKETKKLSDAAKPYSYQLKQ